MFQLKQLKHGTVFRKNDGQLYTDFIEIMEYSYNLWSTLWSKYFRSTLSTAIDIHCRFRSRFIVNQTFVFTFPFPFSLPFPGYCGLTFTLRQAKHGYSGVVKVDWRMAWCSVVFGDENRFCLYASDGHTRVRRRSGVRNLPECIRLQHTGPHLGLHGVGAINYNSRSLLVFLRGTKQNSARYIAHVVNPVLLSFLRQEGDVLFQQDNVRPHTAAATQRALRGVQQLSWPARSPDLSPIELVWDMMKRELILSPKSATITPELRQRVQDAWDNLSQDNIRHLDDRLHARIHACVATRWGYTVYWCNCLGTSYCELCFFLSEYIII